MSKPTEDLKKDLQEPIEKLNGSNVQETFKEIAEKLFKNYYIQCGEKKYYFAEIEFYYYSDKSPDSDGWQGVTYDRIKNVGDLFYHLSGCDICFNSKLEKNKDKKDEMVGFGGGILIRSIEDEEGNVTAGPMTCVNKMLNACGKGNVPFLVKQENKMDLEVQETYRFLGDKDFKLIEKKQNRDGDLKIAFFNKKIEKKSWNKARPSYYSNRFKYVEKNSALKDL
ncbi:MAG: hypothetical protein IJJ77_03060 [Paludibacteraceae bacterium]|nr:hypothetical protein [Paludibacteraceae bacterium]